MKRLLEVCTGDWASVLAAREAGAERIELCCGLEAGGLTPTPAVIRRAVALGGPKVNVLVRPRSGDFVYTPDEADIITDDIVMARECGANGVVIGCLRRDGTVDTEMLRRWHEAAGGMKITFHRAFDLCRDPMAALEEVIPFADTILTSGLAATAADGIEMLAGLCRRADGRIAIMAGGGVNPGNVARIARLTGVPELHGTFSAPQPSSMEFRRQGVSMSAGAADEYMRRSSSATNIRAARAALDSLSD